MTVINWAEIFRPNIPKTLREEHYKLLSSCLIQDNSPQ